ncbi:MAG TPA: beta-eliminating lyase-related protein [Actinomycetes bacterium]
MTDDLDDRLRTAREACTRRLGYTPQRPRDVIETLARVVPDDARPDAYGEGGVVADLEAETAALLGKPAAVFMPSGTMAQQIALRVWADRTGCRTVAYHPTSHLELHEERGYAHLHGLVARPVGSAKAPLTRADLDEVGEPLAALLLELPQREIGGPLPEWDDLVAQTAWARERGVAVHLDGARLWEAAVGYDRPTAEVAALFDTVYVSFYKGLGGLAGACLAGPEDVITEAALWRRRHGGTLVAMWPYAATALEGLRTRLPRLPAHLARAREIADAVRDLPGVEVVVDPPQTPLLHLRLCTTADGIRRAALELATERGWAVPFRSAPSESPRWRVVELMVGESALEWPLDDVRRAVERLATPDGPAAADA